MRRGLFMSGMGVTAVAAAITAVAVRAQDKPRVELVPGEAVRVVNELSRPIMVPVKCDSQGGLYLRSYQYPRPSAAPILRISRDGKDKTLFSLASVKGLEDAQLVDFAVGLRGEVYVLALTKDDRPVLAVFRSDGQYDSTVPLVAGLEPSSLGLFSSGDLLITGFENSPSGTPPRRAFTAIFEKTGRLIKKITLEDDAHPKKEAVPGEKGGQPPPEDSDFVDAVSLGTVAPSEDGNVYLMRHMAAPVVYAISPSGAVLRRMVLSPPADNFRPITMKTAAGRLAVMFEENDPKGQYAQAIFSLYDAMTGEEIVDLLSSLKVGGAFACFTPAGFSFLTSSSEGWLTIQSVSVHF
jgi:hypothetical protein